MMWMKWQTPSDASGCLIELSASTPPARDSTARGCCRNISRGTSSWQETLEPNLPAHARCPRLARVRDVVELLRLLQRPARPRILDARREVVGDVVVAPIQDVQYIDAHAHVLAQANIHFRIQHERGR